MSQSQIVTTVWVICIILLQSDTEAPLVNGDVHHTKSDVEDETGESSVKQEDKTFTENVKEENTAEEVKPEPPHPEISNKSEPTQAKEDCEDQVCPCLADAFRKYLTNSCCVAVLCYSQKYSHALFCFDRVSEELPFKS